MKGPAPRPCESCPYRRDVPSGIWDATEYAKLQEYDRETYDQPPGLFQCHQQDAGSPAARICAGWIGCHGDQLLALRLGIANGKVNPIWIEYSTDVPLWPSGAAAAEHGMADLVWPGRAAREVIRKVAARRGLTE